MTAAGIVEALGGKRGRCQCPACADDGRDAGGDHLAVTERGGLLLVHCFAGCDQRAVIEALKARKLWAEPERREWTRDQRREYALTQAARERELDDAIEQRAIWVGLMHRGKAALRTRGLEHSTSAWLMDALECIEKRIEELDDRIDRLKGRVA